MRKNLIIGGTIKGATTSVFTYLSAHPEICGSTVKETFFFTHDYSGDRVSDLSRYMKYFVPSPGTKILLEASPNYLAYTSNVAPSIKSLLPDAKLLFILRNPVDRFYSYYHFARGKLELPNDLSLDDYFDLCQQYSAGELDVSKSRIAEKHLRALEVGKYGFYLQNFMKEFPPDCIKVMFYEFLRRDPQQFMAEICRFINVDSEFYTRYTFDKANVTFSSRNKPLHRVAMFLNKSLESVLRQRPGLKSRMVRLYKRVNQGREGYTALSDISRARLAEYYAPYNKELAELLAQQTLPLWAGGKGNIEPLQVRNRT